MGFANPPWDQPWDPSEPPGESVEITMQNDDMSECRFDVGEISTAFHDSAAAHQDYSWVVTAGQSRQDEL